MYRVSLLFIFVTISMGMPTSGRTAQIDAFDVANVIGVGEVAVESDYLPRVVACENGAADFEALKVQAVAARTYLYFKMQTSGAIADGTSDQVFTCGNAPLARHYSAVEATRGQVLTHEALESEGAVSAAFYVAGALAVYDDGMLVPGSDPTNTERFVTYNEGLAGDDVRPTSLGSATNPRNRGAMSQNGSHTLSLAGWTYDEILPFYYGADIQLVTATGAEPRLTLSVSRTTGAGFLRNMTPGTIDFDAYSIHSPSGSLDPQAWQSLQQAGLSGWEEAHPTATDLSELNLLESTLLRAGRRITLGRFFDAAGEEDITFEFHATGGGTVEGIVAYFGPPGPLGDADGDGDVDIDDLNHVRNQFGGTGAGILGDTDGDADVDIDDLNNVRNNFGATANAVPEPAAIYSAAIALLIGCLPRRSATTRRSAGAGKAFA